MIDSWTCHVCGENRPDQSISVRKHDNSEKYGFSPGVFMENVRYCNDKESCIQGSKTHSHFNKESAQTMAEGNLKRINEFVESNTPKQKEKIDIMKLKYVYTFLIFFAIVMVLNPFLATVLQDDVTFMEKFFSPAGIFMRVLIASYFSWRYASKIFPKM